ncbi:hypothetical protein STEG23_011028 [Scotinomys teguina]
MSVLPHNLFSITKAIDFCVSYNKRVLVIELCLLKIPLVKIGLLQSVAAFGTGILKRWLGENEILSDCVISPRRPLFTPGDPGIFCICLMPRAVYRILISSIVLEFRIKGLVKDVWWGLQDADTAFQFGASWNTD